MLEYRPPRIAMLLLALATALHFACGESMPPMAGLPAGAIVSGIAGLALMLRAWWLFKTRDTPICPTATSSVLITTDVYRLTRNPMYLGIALMMTGVALFTGGPFFYLATLAFFVIIDHSFCRYEEAKLARDFPQAFAVYAKVTRRWL
jgi:protein-S-isoprenylcysteine O-methyltransferase Ste14